MSQTIIDQMLVERSKLTRALKALGWEEFPADEAKEPSAQPEAPGTNGPAKTRGAGAFWKSKKSAAARQAQSEKMKAIWAKRKRDARKGK
jgi:hypothetical protein